MQAFLTRVYENGHIYKGTYEGLYCVACEAYYTEDATGRRQLSRSTTGRSSSCPRRTGSSGCRRSPQPLLDWYAANPDAVAPEGKRNEALGIIRHGLDDISITRTSIDWGVPVPWDDGHVFYVWYDALINYATAIGYGDDDERVRTPGGRRSTTCSARTSCASTASTGRPCCWPPARRHRPTSTSTASCWWAARR